ncbi:hypothetical protein SAMN05878503_1016 [Cereibacter ovatus]|uniref:Uncharacterized protein n=1 Tax=Cereibacter ovatus TaxID=439529 RepID=A0A285CIF5_9RHOB|nr:hypothetical protein [Cereibacter ovatus]SNX67374.1 hypothetical protein SAMN05878503_1016 [Cereibacter ovatus]
MAGRKTHPRRDAIQIALKEEARTWVCVVALLVLWGALSHWMGG